MTEPDLPPDLPPDFAERAVSFDGTAEAYERGRPGYPTDLIASLFADFGLDRPRILDLGAGTGKLTRHLVDFGPVTAVEPLANMRAQLERAVPQATALEGNASAIPLPDDSVDVVMVGQAYHWFDQRTANPEIARVLTGGGHLVAIWNDEVHVPWIDQLTQIVSPGTEPWARDPDWWLRRFVHAPWFTVPVRRDGSMTVVTSTSDLLARMESHSALSVLTPAERAPVLDRIAALVADFPDPFDVDYETEAYWCTKLPSSGS